MPPVEKSPTREVLKGVGLVFGLHIFAGLAGLAYANWGPRYADHDMLAAFFYLGVTQLLWVLPAALWAGVRHKYGLRKGILIAAGLTILVNGACWTFFLC